MKTITWASEANALKAVLANKDLYVISIVDPYGTNRDTYALRKQINPEQLHCITCTLDNMVEKVNLDTLTEYLMKIPADADLIVHCSEGRFRSKYLVEVIRNAVGRHLDRFLESAPCLGIKGEISRDAVWSHIRPMMFPLEDKIKQYVKQKEEMNNVDTQ